MAEARYPARERQVALLRLVHEWINERNAKDDLAAIVDGSEVERWASAIEGMSKTEVKFSLEQLHDEGYFTLMHKSTEISCEPFVYIVPRALTEKGLVAIGEMPDPGEKLVRAFEAVLENIERADLPEPKKRELLNKVWLVIHTLRTAEGVADMAGRMFGG